MKPLKPIKKRRPDAVLPARRDERDFAEVVELIRSTRGRALAAVNTALVDLYWRVGEHISRKLDSAAWGDGVVDELSKHIQKHFPSIGGFTRANLFRMRQFHETYRGNAIVAALLRQLPWTHNLTILSQCKRAEEREFYIRLAIQEKWTSRELSRQLAGALFERAVLSPPRSTRLFFTRHSSFLFIRHSSVIPRATNDIPFCLFAAPDTFRAAGRLR